jgi:hypothetical protein
MGFNLGAVTRTPLLKCPALIATVLTGIATLAVYWVTLAPSVVGGDAGELITGTACGGVLHPPGYPLYTMLGKLFLLLPFGEPALRMNVFSCVCGVAAAVMLQRAAARWSGSPWAGVMAAGWFAFSAIVWEHAVGAEVFSLHHAFVAALLWIAVAYAETGESRWVWIGAGVAALGMSHHHTLVFFAAPMALWPLLREPGYWLKPRRVACLAGIGLLGILPYLWLPFASARAAPVSWGDCTTWAGFWNHFTRADYGTLQLASGEVTASGGWSARLGEWIGFQGNAVLWIGLAMMVSGLVVSIRHPKWKALAIGSFLTVMAYVLVFNYLANLPPTDPLLRSVLVRFWTAPHLVACAWLAVGWAAWTAKRPRLAAIGALALTTIPVVMNFGHANRREAMEFSDYGAAWLTPLPPNAILLARGDLIVNTLTYRQICTGLRKDVLVLDLERMTYHWQTGAMKKQHPELVLPGSRYHPGRSDCYNLKSLIEANPRLGPWFVAGDLTPGEIAGLPGWNIRPHGLGWKLWPPGETFDFNPWWTESEQALPGFRVPSAAKISVDPWAASVASDFGESHNRRGVAALEAAAALNNAPAILRRAVEVFQSQSEKPDAPARVFKNLGIAWQRLEGRDPNAARNAAEAWRRFLELDGGKDKDAAAIRQWLNGR